MTKSNELKKFYYVVEVNVIDIAKVEDIQRDLYQGIRETFHQHGQIANFDIFIDRTRMKICSACNGEVRSIALGRSSGADLFRCSTCFAIQGRCPEKIAMNIVDLNKLDNGSGDDECREYFDFVVAKDDGVQYRAHGWRDITTKTVVQFG